MPPSVHPTEDHPARERITVEPPPALEPAEGVGGVLTSAVPMLGSLGSVVLVATMATQSGGGGQRSLVAAAMLVLGTLGFVVVQVERQRSRRARLVARARSRYLRHLADVRRRLRRAGDRQRDEVVHHHPPPGALPALAADGSRVAERQAGHPHHLVVRYAVAPAPLAAELVLPDPAAVEDPDPVAGDALDRLLAAHASPAGLPVLLDLAGTSRLVVGGDPDGAHGLARALVSGAATFHAPADLVVAALVSPAARSRWEWLKWLPHALDATHSDAVGPRRLVVTDPEELASVRPGAHLLLVVDGADCPATGWRPAVTVVDLGADGLPPADLAVHVDRGGELTLTRRDRPPVRGRADHCDTATAEALARRLLAHHGTGGRQASWPGPASPGRLRVPIGVDGGGRPVHLDLDEASRGGAGPHGLLVGATGSGKSELLRTLVLGLAMAHPSERLHLVLVDFKGGATFAGLAPLPHVAALVTNLADDHALVDRMDDALSGELVRRQEVLRQAGGFGSVHDLAQARAADPTLPELPPLLVVVDEFAELLTARPEFLDVLTALGRLGRSLGIHLLLASQRLEEGRLRGLEAHLSYRIGLRTFSAAESRAALGVPDAAALPPTPGVGLLRTGPEQPLRFRAAYVSGPATTTPRPGLGPYPSTEVVAPADLRRAAGSLLDERVARLASHGTPARRIWLPPLDRSPTLGELAAAPAAADGLVLPLGIVDLPRDQRHDPLLADLGGAGGHVGIVGGPRSGRTTLLQSIVAAVALTRTPQQARCYAIDLAGGGLAPLAGLPHVSVVATRADPELVRRVVAAVGELLDRREALRTAGRPDDDPAEVLVVVDGWAALRPDLDDLEPLLHRIAARGLAHGVHLVVATGRWADVRAATRDLLGTRLELRLGDPLDSEVDRTRARLVPRDRPGRGLTATGHHFLAALPRLDGDPDPATASTGLADLVARVATATTGPPAPPLPRLPARVTVQEARAAAGARSGAVIGLDDHLDAVLLTTDGPGLVVLGDRGSGRTTALRTLVHEIARTHAPERAQLTLVDPRRTLLGEVPPDRLLAHHGSAATAGPALREVADHLRGRLPGPGVSPRQLRERSWWSGADVVVVVDDLDLLPAGSASPLAPMVPLLPHAREVGLRLVVARRSAGAARAWHEPGLRELRELDAPTLLLPGRADEGPVLGRLTPVPGPPGRGRLVTRGEVRPLQVAWSDPSG